MPNVIDVIEQWGRDAQWRHASDDARDAALIQAGFDPALRTAMLGEDQNALESLIGATHNICCLVNHPEEEEQGEEFEDDEEEDEEESEDDEDEE